MATGSGSLARLLHAPLTLSACASAGSSMDPVPKIQQLKHLDTPTRCARTENQLDISAYSDETARARTNLHADTHADGVCMSVYLSERMRKSSRRALDLPPFDRRMNAARVPHRNASSNVYSAQFREVDTGTGAPGVDRSATAAS